MFADTVQRLRELPPPALELTLQRRSGTDARSAAREGRFRVFDRDVELVPSVDWNPGGTPSFRAALHKLFFLDPLLQEFDEAGAVECFDRAAAIALDWVRANPRAGTGLEPYAWGHKVTGDRAPCLAYVLRAGAAAGRLDDQALEALLTSLVEHGRALADDEHYSFGNNHGLYQDKGLLLLAKYLEPCLPEAKEWRAHAAERFRANVASCADRADGVWLEHSSSYVYSTINLMRSIEARTPLDDPEIDELYARMVATSTWLSGPDGRVPQIGDTDGMRVEPDQDGPFGLRSMLGAGWVIVRTPTSHLHVTAAYHSRYHKHADELSFELNEGDRRVLIDPGKFAYDRRAPHRQHATAARAHNCLIVDDVEFDPRVHEPYRSGIVAAGDGDGWYGIAGHNPLVERQGIRHRRLIVYRPGALLVVVDDLESDDEHTYTRWFHASPDLSVVSVDGAARLEGDGFAGELRDYSGFDVLMATVRGGQDPIQGWAYPANGVAVPATSIGLSSVGGSCRLVATVSLNGCAPGSILVTGALDDLTIAAPDVGVHLRRRATVLDLTQRESL